MRSGFLLSVRFWVATWIVILFLGLTPLPPVAELVIVVGFVVHGIWFFQHRLRAMVITGALARADRAEEEEFRRQQRRRRLGNHSEQALAHPGPADPIYHGAPVDSAVGRPGGGL
jgi:hypothetical protein